MPGVMLNDTRGGTRSEYLAQFLLATLGVSVPVLRQEDIGADFYCTLAKLEGRRLTFEGSYIVQTKTTPVKPVRYGGPKNRRRKSEQIEWLFGQELPLLLGYVDMGAQAIHLYTTSNMWPACWSGGPGQVILEPAAPDTEAYEYSPPSTEMVSRWPEGIGDGKRWHVPLGPPVLSFTADDAEDPNSVSLARQSLLSYLPVEQANIGYRRFNIHYARIPYVRSVSTDGLRQTGHKAWAASNRTPGANIGDQLLSIAPGLITLGLNLRDQESPDGLMSLRPLVQLMEGAIPDSLELWSVRQLLPELFPPKVQGEVAPSG